MCRWSWVLFRLSSEDVIYGQSWVLTVGAEFRVPSHCWERRAIKERFFFNIVSHAPPATRNSTFQLIPLHFTQMQPTYCPGGFPHHSCSKSLCGSTWTIQNCLQIMSWNQFFPWISSIQTSIFLTQKCGTFHSLHPKFHLLSSELYLTCRNPKLILLRVWRCFLPKHCPLDLTDFYKIKFL